MQQIANGQIRGTFLGQSLAQRQQKKDKLKARHDEVVRHEDAHYRKAAEHGLEVQSPVLSDWVEGPEGQQYATGGHVMIGTGTTGNPIEDARRGQGMIEAAEAPLSVDSELSEADKQIAEKGRAIVAANEPKARQVRDLKNRLGNSGFTLPPSMVKSMVAGMGLDIPRGQLVNLFGV
jgi:SprA family protein